ncbi:MAG TPA: CBS domain-containing protein [Candidatus Binataceae bacterium]|nr:CBS domain-containing protein [Candidatus Binataceae bacterium]
MSFPYKNILCPVDFDDSSMAALHTAREIAHTHDGTVFLLHVVPMIIQPTGMPVYVDLYKSQEEVAWTKLRELARRELASVKHELIVSMGDPAATILRTIRKVGPDVLVMATHGRRGFSRFFLGSVAEMVLREATCPVLTVRPGAIDRNMVGTWMTTDPVTANPSEKLSQVRVRMSEGEFRSIPVVGDDGRLVGVITDRDLRRHEGFLEHTEVKQAMSEQPITLSPSASIHEAARLLRERKIGGIPVVEGDKVVGMITMTDVLKALTEPEAS